MKHILSVALGLSIVAGTLASAAPAHAFFLKNYHTGYCLGVAAGTANPGQPFVQWHCDRSASQTFSTQIGAASTPASSVQPNNTIGLFNAVSWWTNSITDISRTPAIDGTKVVLGFWGGQARQAWVVDSQRSFPGYGVQCYRLRNATTTNEVMGVSGGSHTEGAAIITWNNFENVPGNPNAWQDHLDQFWCAVDNV